MAASALSAFREIAIAGSTLPGIPMIGVAFFPTKLPQQVQAQFSQLTAVWSTLLGYDLKLNRFIPFVGCCKLVGLAGMFGAFGRTGQIVCSVLYIILCGCAAYTHHELNDPVGPPVLVGLLVLSRLIYT